MTDEATSVTFVLEVEKYPCLYNFNLPEYSRRDITEKAWSSIAQQLNLTGKETYLVSAVFSYADEIVKNTTRFNSLSDTFVFAVIMNGIFKWMPEDCDQLGFKDLVSICKEKWRNLRSVYLRRKKLSKGGKGKKLTKPYYLNEYMQFLQPYMKTMTSFTNDLPSPITEATAELITEEDDTREQVPVPDEPVCSIEETTSHKRPRNTSTRNKVNKISIDYFKQKTSKDRIARKYFLLSLLPEINELTQQNFKIFRRRLLALLDDISEPQFTNLPYADSLPSTSASSSQ